MKSSTKSRKRYRKTPGGKIISFAACLHFNPQLDLNIESKLRPYGGLIGIDNLSWEDRLKDSKILRLHAVLHDAAGFVHDQ